MADDNGPPEVGLSRRHMLMGGALAVTAGVAYLRTPEVAVPPLKEGVLEGLIPTKFAAWDFETRSGLVLPPDDPLSKSLYTDILTRVYVARDRPPMMLLIAYSNTQNGMLQVHRPEVCYPAGGYELTETQIRKLDLAPGLKLPVRYFSASSASRTEQVMYWTRIGSESPTSWIDQRAAVVRANLQRIIPDGILVRISTVMPDSASAERVIGDFAKDLIHGLSPAARKLLVAS